MKKKFVYEEDAKKVTKSRGNDKDYGLLESLDILKISKVEKNKRAKEV
jgi:hypothetical protein